MFLKIFYLSMDCKKLQTGRSISSTFTLLLYIDRFCFLELVLDMCSLPHCYCPPIVTLCCLSQNSATLFTTQQTTYNAYFINIIRIDLWFFSIKRRILSLKNNVYLRFNFCYVVMTTFNYGDLCIIRVKELISTAVPLFSHFWLWINREGWYCKSN